MRKNIYLIFILLYQIGNSQTFKPNLTLCESCEKDLYFKIESSSFLKNNEYFTNLTEGRTEIGVFAIPTLAYYLNHNTKVELGAFLLKFSGRNDLSQVLPVFRVQHKISKNFQLVFGNIFGSLNHNLSEPVYRFDRYFQNYMEYGLQFLYDSPQFVSDLWVNWEKYIFDGDPYQEEFLVGNTSEFNFLEFKKINISVNGEFLIFHKGGQLDLSDNGKYTTFNGMLGLRFRVPTKTNRNFIFEPQFLLFNRMHFDSDHNLSNYKNGGAKYLKIRYETKRVNSLIGLWKAKDFFAPKGEFLFQSVSEIDENFYLSERELLTSKIAYKHTIGNSIKLEAGINCYYDLIDTSFDYSYGFYFVFDESIFIKNLKKKK